MVRPTLFHSCLNLGVTNLVYVSSYSEEYIYFSSFYLLQFCRHGIVYFSVSLLLLCATKVNTSNSAPEVCSQRHTPSPPPSCLFPFIDIILILLNSVTKGILYIMLLNTLKHSQKLYGV
jgi:hypothetical protein